VLFETLNTLDTKIKLIILFKYLDQSIFEKLTQNLSLEEDILIIKNGLIRDTSFSNVILFEKNLKK
jgi:hypothetical protein